MLECFSYILVADFGDIIPNLYDLDILKFQVICSSGKSIESIVMSMLYEKELFKYEDKVIQHWPEFGQNGKEDVKICDILRHESGLAYFSKPIPTLKAAWTENIKENKIGEFIEEESLHFPVETDGINFKREYHGGSKGLIINELVRRLHPEVLHVLLESYIFINIFSKL